MCNEKYWKVKECEIMYGNYGNYNGYGNQGGGYSGYNGYSGYEEYGRRGVPGSGRGRYRGHEQIDRMGEEYGRYQESRRRYGAGQESDKSFHYMLEALEDFVKVLQEEANTPQQKQKIMETLQKSMM